MAGRPVEDPGGGVWKVGEEKLGREGIQTLGELAAAPNDMLRRIFGVYAASIRLSARGVGEAELVRARGYLERLETARAGGS